MARRTRSGTKITDALAESLADEAERGYELRGPGRPSLSGGDPSPQVTFRLPRELREQASRRAEAEGTSISALAREALERFLAS
ncbi:MAG: Arc family DNA-binding protein [Candidatus Nanopelagicales bacterium]|nr:Arc family DNA-binding protein [Candidatus Nanopelagicales bacterium]MDZ4249614.1 Arc family DNA-binding protein [Candidatus Nanopelagicales bacterium]MDZ7577188.1 Arc family DNA-binding protein [Candidatus Nanopelagicales bacterium]